MTYFLIGLYVFISMTISAFIGRIDKAEENSFWLFFFFWPFVAPILIGIYLADKVKGVGK